MTRSSSSFFVISGVGTRSSSISLMLEMFHCGGPKGQFREKIEVQGQRMGLMEG